MRKSVAKVFMSGDSQAIRLPVAFRFDADEVFTGQFKYNYGYVTIHNFLDPCPIFG